MSANRADSKCDAGTEEWKNPHLDEYIILSLTANKLSHVSSRIVLYSLGYDSFPGQEIILYSIS